MSQWIEGRVDLAEGMTFTATNAAGNSIILEPGGSSSGRGVSPMEVVLLGLGGCTGIDVISTLRKMRQRVSGYQVRVRGERREEHPRVYTRIEVEHLVRGQGVRPSAVQRAIALSADRYCSVSAMLAQGADVEISYRVVDERTGDEVRGTVRPAPEDSTTGTLP